MAGFEGACGMTEAEFAGEVALVTGGGRGIGRATAELLADRGARVAICGRTSSELNEVRDSIQLGGGVAAAITMDVEDEASVERAIAEASAELGPISMLVNNAGVALLKPALETTVAEWDHMFSVNVRGSFLCARAVIPGMRSRGGGVIVNVASIWATRGGPNRAPYIASKHAVVGLTRALAEEFKEDQIRVIGVNPGPVDTSMTRAMAATADRTGWMEPEDIAQIVVFLCGPYGGVMTGSVIDAFGAGAPIQTR